MRDRLLSGAGAVSYLADRIVAVFMRGQGGAVGSVGLLLAAVLAIGAAVGLWSAIDNSGDRSLHSFTAGELATADPGDHLYATVEGAAASVYIESYRDTNDDGKQSPDETGLAWTYFMVDPATRAGVTVQSDRPPTDVFRYVAKGVVVDDAEYVAEDLTRFQETIADLGVTLEPSRYIDATRSGTFAPHDLADGVPVEGTAVEIDATRAVDFVTVCTTDKDSDGVCSEDEVDRWDLLVYDAASHNAVTVLTDQSPEFVPATFTGLLRRSPTRVEEAKKVDNDPFDLNDAGITVSSAYLLDDGATLREPISLLIPALIAALLAALIVIGTLAGPLRFRPDPAAAPGQPGSPLASGERVPVHVTGILRAGDGYARSRETPADLVRFVLTPEPTSAVEPTPAAEPTPSVEPRPTGEVPPTLDGPAREAPTTLIVERRAKPQGVAVGRGELTSLEVGTAMPFRGPRPALRLRAGTGTLLLSFDSVAARDRAAHELRVETGITGGS